MKLLIFSSEKTRARQFLYTSIENSPYSTTCTVTDVTYSIILCRKTNIHDAQRIVGILISAHQFFMVTQFNGYIKCFRRIKFVKLTDPIGVCGYIT